MKDFAAYSRLKHAPATSTRYFEVVRHFERLITPATVQAVTRKDAMRCRTLRGAEIKGKSLAFKRSTLNYELEVMRAVFGYAVRDLQSIETNPFSRVEKLK
jgi:hypothetical protein